MWEFKYQDGEMWTSVRLTDVDKKEDFIECMPALFDDMTEWVADMKNARRIESAVQAPELEVRS